MKAIGPERCGATTESTEPMFSEAWQLVLRAWLTTNSATMHLGRVTGLTRKQLSESKNVTSEQVRGRLAKEFGRSGS